jgi:hypothetical protein
MSTEKTAEQSIDLAIQSLEQAMQALRDLGLMTEGDDE